MVMNLALYIFFGFLPLLLNEFGVILVLDQSGLILLGIPFC